MSARLLLTLLLVVVAAMPPARAERTELDVNTRNLFIQNLSFISDSSSALSFDQVREPSFQDRFQPNTPQTLVNPAVQTYWVRFSLVNTTPETNTWILEAPGWERIDFYLVDTTGKVTTKAAGHYTAYAERDYPVGNRNYLKILLHPGEVVQCFARLHCTRTNVEPFPLHLGLFASIQSHQFSQDSTIKATISMFVGILLIMFAFNLFIFLSTRDKTYFWYLGTILCIAYLTANNSGYLHEFMAGWAGFIPFRVPAALAVVVLLVVFSLNFARSFLEVRTRFPFWNKVFNILIGLAILAFLMTFVNFEAGWNLSNMINLVTVLSLMIVSVKSALQKYPGSWIFLTAYGANMLGAFILLFALVGVIPYTLFSGNLAFPAGTTLEVVLFSFALANRINILKREKELSQHNALNLALENERIVRDQNEILEKKVDERTEEIRQQTHQIMAQKAQIEVEKENSDRLLENILPKSTAEELKANGFATPKYYEQATILFTDVHDFTHIAEKLNSQELVENLNYCFQHFDDIVSRHNLEKIKTIGDAYMCVGGIPNPSPTHAVDCVRAALEMQDFIHQWNAEQEMRGEAPWQIRIGIHSGPVTAGVVGKRKFAYDIWGDTVNLASRMESNGEIEKVNISEDTWKLVRDVFECESRGSIDVKNKGKVNMYFVGRPLAPAAP